jgi:DNA-binding NarL/FixJ family response regulator
MNVLIVDDHGLVRRGLQMLMQSLPGVSEVTTAKNRDEARYLAANRAFDIVFMDVELGKTDPVGGLDLLKEWKEADNDTRVVMLSAQEVSGDKGRELMLQAIESGAYGYIEKSEDDVSVIVRAMEIALRGGVYLPPSFRESRGGYRPSLPAPSATVGYTEIPLKPVTARDLGLTPRQYETAYYVGQGLSNKAIARQMSITENVVAEYVTNVYRQLGVSSRTEFMAMLNKLGYRLLPPAQASAP